MNEEDLALARSMVAEETAAAAQGEPPQNPRVRNLQDKAKVFRWVMLFIN